MADPREGWLRDRDRDRARDEDEWRRRREEDLDWPSYGRGGWGRTEAWRRARPQGDWRREGEHYGREDYGRSDYERDDRCRRDWRERDRGFEGSDWGRYGYSEPERWDRDERYGGEGWGRSEGFPEYGRRSGGYDDRWGREPDRDYGRGWSGSYERDRWSGSYGRDRSGTPYGARGTGYGARGAGERGWWDRTSDEVSSWFGDEQAERRRQEDERRRDIYRGRGPRGYTRSDERVREDVSDRLTDNPILDASEIDVAVESGEVTLSGTVDSRYSKRLAEDIAEEVSGVRHVQNNLRVRHADRGWQTAELGRTDRSGLSGSSGTGNTSGAMTGSAGAVAGTTSGDTSGNADAQRLGGATMQSTRGGGSSTTR